MKNMKTFSPNIPHNTNTGMKQLGLTHNQQIPRGTQILEHTYMHNKMWLMSLTKKNVACQQPIVMTLWIPRTTPLPKFPIHGCSLTRPQSTFKDDKIDNDKVNWESIRPLLRFINSSSHLGHQFLNKNNMNKLCLLKHKMQQRCLHLK